ncbi:hypothetical protein BH10ACI2_BH10ACI2_13780 [soil metagenome]
MKIKSLILGSIFALMAQVAFAQDLTPRPTALPAPVPKIPATPDPVAWIKVHEKKLADTSGLVERSILLRYIATAAVAANDAARAEEYANELIETAKKLKETPGPLRGGFGFVSEANFYGNTVLGHVAIKANNIESAKQYLLLAGDVDGSPVLNSSGPGMSLVKLLLEKGERDTVMKFFDQCAKFWKNDEGRLVMWKDTVAAGHMPYFGTSATTGMTTWRVVE